MLIDLREVFAGYGGGDVLQGLDLGVENESVTCIVGPNGAGKSTVLRVVSGLLSPRQGSVHFDGNPIGGETNTTYNATASGNYTVVASNGDCSSAAFRFAMSAATASWPLYRIGPVKNG